MKEIKRYKFAILLLLCLAGLAVFNPDTAITAGIISLKDAMFILSILPPILILVGLFDVWVPKETVIRFMGQGAGVKGFIVAFILGTIAAGPLFIAFPIAAMLASKGARLANILFFMGVWTSAKVPMVLLEVSFLGGTFTFIHVITGTLMYLLGSFLIEKLAPESSIATLKSMVSGK